jgi:undecaprenyl diphosphate synthase
MAMGRIAQLKMVLRSVLDGGASLREAERQAELARLRFRDGRAIPQHIAVIMDGNGRWATSRHLPRALGHNAGVEGLRRVVRLCDEYSVPMLSVYAFSTENWGRPQEEVDALMRLMWETIRTDVDRLHSEGVKLRHIGRLGDLAPDVRDAIQHMMELTKDNTKFELNVCFNYGGRAELVDAVREIVAAGTPAEEITEELIGQHLYTRNLPDPDLIIRTGGEMRLSNYLIWQAAYAEYYSTPTLWPDFSREDFLTALDAFAGRKRRFGKLDSQLEAEQASRTHSLPASSSSSSSSTSSSIAQPAIKGVH